jgi:hypothetical protein
VVKTGIGGKQTLTQLHIPLLPRPRWYFEMHAAMAGNNHPVDVTVNKHNATNFEMKKSI